MAHRSFNLPAWLEEVDDFTSLVGGLDNKQLHGFRPHSTIAHKAKIRRQVIPSCDFTIEIASGSLLRYPALSVIHQPTLDQCHLTSQCPSHKRELTDSFPTGWVGFLGVAAAATRESTGVISHYTRALANLAELPLTTTLNRLWRKAFP